MSQQQLHSQVAPQFWSHFKSALCETDMFKEVHQSIDELHHNLSAYWLSLERLTIVQSYVSEPMFDHAVYRETLASRLQLLVKAIIFSCTRKHFQDAMYHFYFQAFKAFNESRKENECDDDTPPRCDGCDNEKDLCSCDETLTVFQQVNSQLKELDLLAWLSGEPVTSLIHQRIKQHVEHSCQSNFEVPYLFTLEEWLETKVVGWLELMYCEVRHGGASEGARGSVAPYKDRLYYFLHDIYARTRIQQLFNIIIEFPESEPALTDLKCCLEKTNLRGMLVQALRTALETRLLHPGVNTCDILTAYISAIRALRVLDPTGVLLDLVCEPVRKYLRNRDDTVRSIVSSLIEDSNSELLDELVKTQPGPLDDSYTSDDQTDNWQIWQPDPVDAIPVKSASSVRRSADIISMLVNIYGSKEVFVNEYRTLLADRILTHYNYDTARELRYLELLKLRFGETQLHACEVMLKDVADSKRLNTRIREQWEQETGDEKAIAVNAMVLSAQFWPTFREEKVTLPDELQTSLDAYTDKYKVLKGNRTLCWKPHLGLVNLEIELKDKTLKLSVSPVHATILWHFQQKARWTVDELSGVTHMPAHALRRKIAFWQSHGLLKEESSDSFLLMEEQPGHGGHDLLLEDDEAESAMASSKDQKEEEMQVIWSYVVGMLTNLESLPLDRVHSMLKMFAMQGPGSECTIDDLKVFLDRKVKEQVLIYSGGFYRLPKQNS
ncbi:hypothetical protein NP493_106g06023 [Ridgeia piscesae]|uniref:Anaphase-promoting complex subunit 2 n=2 Tax=Ridgeia piscesae TaxID=27915 RepID=A0AAD9P7F6_RIDPI|nr:hypothetical protein NP493_106g06023 [Ridgeia piscesae]